MNASRTILVVDDEQDILELLDSLLRRKGYRVLTANNGNEALELLERESVDLLLADLKMPGLNGFRLVSELQRRLPGLPIVVMSGYGQQMEPMLAELGVRHYIVKPIDFDALFGLFKEILQKPSSV